MQEFIVSTLEDENDGDFGEGDLSLREAIALANDAEGEDTITIDASINDNAISLNNGLQSNLVIDDSVFIVAAGENQQRIVGESVFEVAENVDVEIANFNFISGRIDNSGNLNISNSSFRLSNDTSIVSWGTLDLQNVLVQNNSGDRIGVSIESGTAEIKDSAIVNNEGFFEGTSGLTIDEGAEVFVSNSTIANNRNDSAAGIINAGSLSVSNSTVVGNNGGEGAGGIVNSGEATVTSTIVADNTGGANVGDISGEGEFTSGGFNLVGNGDSANGFLESDIVGTADNPVNPLLRSLEFNEDSTPTFALRELSPAIDNGTNPNNLATDQRGLPRVSGAAIDIGAVERQVTVEDENNSPQTITVSILEDEDDGDISEEDLSLREAIATANSGDTITFNSSLSGGTINLSLGELSIDKSLTIQGLGADQLTIDNTEVGRVFKIDDGNIDNELNVILDGLAITGGFADSSDSNGRGGGIFTEENLELINSSVSGNGAVTGGGIYSSGDRLRIDNSTIENNSASITRGVGEGGGLLTIGTTVEIVNSSIADNNSASSGGGLDVRDSQVTITNSSIADNFGVGGGGIDSVSSNVNVNRTVISGNRTSSFGGSGAIDSDADSVLTVDRSSIDGNSGIDPFNPTPPRGSQAFASGIGARGTTTISNSTISNNTVERLEGEPEPSDDSDISTETEVGYGVRNTGDLNVINSTFAGNTDAGINNDGGTVNISNTTIADRLIGVDLSAVDSNNTVTSTIVVDDSREEVEIDENSNLLGNSDDLLLGELQDNGGTTPTVALLDGSPAIDAGSNPNNQATDQRGSGFDRTVGADTDIGAFELQTIVDGGGGGMIPDELVVSTLEDENDGDLSEADLSLREAIAIANEQEGTDTISFAESLSGGTISLTESIEDPRGLGTINAELSITDSVKIDGLGANNLTLDGLNAGGGIFRIGDENINVTVEGLNITNGSRQAFFFPGSTSGGAVLVESSSSSFALRNSIISNSNATSGAAISSSGNVEIVNSLITGNASSGGSSPEGAVVVNGNLSVVNSTVTQNTGVGITNLGTADIINSTITDGIRLINPDSTTITSSIVLRNGDTNAPSITSNLGQGITSGGNNLIGNGDGIVGLVDSDLVGTGDNILDPLLSELQDNGGSTPTIALLEKSPAIDAGSNPNNLAIDQRGEGFDRTVGNGTDIGAFELQTIVPPSVNEIVGTDRGDVLDGTEESDRILGLDANDTIRGLGGDDTIEGGNGNDSLDGGAGNDFLDGFDGFDSLFGGEGNDTLDAGSGNDSIDGGAGNDSLIGSGDRDTLLGGDGEDTLEGGAGVDSLDGGAGNDQLFGGLDNDSLFGGNGNDLIDGGLGNDSLRGNDGDDTFVLASGNGTDTIADFNRGNNLLRLSSGINFADLSFSGNNIILGDETLATLNGFDAASLTQSNFVTDIGALEVSQENENEGNGSNEPINNESSGGTQPPTPLLDGDDVINGDNGDNVLLGGEGNNILYGFEGNDRLETGSGNDTLDANKGDDTLIGGDGNNILFGFDGNDVLETGSGNDTLDAGNGDDTITAGGGNDIITAGSGLDLINAGAGSDTIDGGADADTIDAGGGDDLINGNIGNDTLTAGAGNDTLIGGGGDDLLTGDGGGDLFVLDAQGGANSIQDFNPTQDLLGLADEITFDDLTITGSSDAAIAFEGETIGIIANIAASDLTADNFVIYEI